jgi:hypothetical protein
MIKNELSQKKGTEKEMEKERLDTNNRQSFFENRYNHKATRPRTITKDWFSF